jgi:dihydrofolate reductase
MRKVFVSEFLSLDGIMEEPAWTMPYWNDEIAAFKGAEFKALDAHLLGRVTYEGFALAWPSRPDEGGGAEMNYLPKYVVSTTLEKAEWNNSHIIRTNVAEEIRKLKAQPGKDIMVHGSATLVQTLIKENLADEYHLLVYPVVLGKGKRLFKDGTAATLQLVDTQKFSTGVVALILKPAPVTEG